MTGRARAREEVEKGRIAGAWYAAGFARMKRLPDLELLLSGGELPEQSGEDMLAVLMAIANKPGVVMEFEEVEHPPWAQQ